MKHANSATREECKTNNVQLKKCNMKILQYKKSATWKNYEAKKCKVERLQKEKIVTWKYFTWHEQSATWNNAITTWKKCNMKKVSLTRVKYGKNAQEYCTILQKRITGCLLSDGIH